MHDAILIEAPLDALEAAVEAAQQVMSDASAIVLGGFRLRSDAKIVRYPERYEDERGRAMWETVWELVDGLPRPLPTEAPVPQPETGLSRYTDAASSAGVIPLEAV